MSIRWTETQMKRLKELEAGAEEYRKEFETGEERDRAYHELEKKLIKKARKGLQELRDKTRRPLYSRLESALVEALTAAGFVQVVTPTIMSRSHLAKMISDKKHPLYTQVYWVEEDKCLRPMLAPHLYYVLKDLLRIWEKPVSIFEVGSCFRKESQGAHHSTEFTMLNLVEMGLPEPARQTRLEEMAALVMKTAGVENYTFETEDSTVYGQTIDIVAGDEKIEVGSAAMGPHPLDIPWRITDAWVGIGFGLERLLMVKENTQNLAKIGRSLSYLDGIRLNI